MSTPLARRRSHLVYLVTEFPLTTVPLLLLLMGIFLGVVALGIYLTKIGYPLSGLILIVCDCAVAIALLESIGAPAPPPSEHISLTEREDRRRVLRGISPFAAEILDASPEEVVN